MLLDGLYFVVARRRICLCRPFTVVTWVYDATALEGYDHVLLA